jgi:hypothetical protein
MKATARWEGIVSIRVNARTDNSQIQLSLFHNFHIPKTKSFSRAMNGTKRTLLPNRKQSVRYSAVRETTLTEDWEGGTGYSVLGDDLLQDNMMGGLMVSWFSSRIGLFVHILLATGRTCNCL